MWLSETLSTITSKVLTKLTVAIAAATFSNENAARSWSPLDTVLDRFNLCEDVALVIRLKERVEEDLSKRLTKRYFPLMWKNGRVVFEVLPSRVEGALPGRIQRRHR